MSEKVIEEYKKNEKYNLSNHDEAMLMYVGITRARFGVFNVSLGKDYSFKQEELTLPLDGFVKKFYRGNKIQGD